MDDNMCATNREAHPGCKQTKTFDKHAIVLSITSPEIQPCRFETDLDPECDSEHKKDLSGKYAHYLQLHTHSSFRNPDCSQKCY